MNARENGFASYNARWTHMLIPDIRIWLQQKHGDIDFYISQLFSGYGCFLEYRATFWYSRIAILSAMREYRSEVRACIF